MAKDYSWWIGEFHRSVSFAVADQWCERNVGKISDECNRLGRASLLEYTKGKTAQKNVARWLVMKSKLAHMVLADLKKSKHPFIKHCLKEMYTQANYSPKCPKALRSDPMNRTLLIVLESYIHETEWWKLNHKALRKEGKPIMLINQVHEGNS